MTKRQIHKKFTNVSEKELNKMKKLMSEMMS